MKKERFFVSMKTKVNTLEKLDKDEEETSIKDIRREVSSQDDNLGSWLTPLHNHIKITTEI